MGVPPANPADKKHYIVFLIVYQDTIVHSPFTSNPNIPCIIRIAGGRPAEATSYTSF